MLRAKFAKLKTDAQAIITKAEGEGRGMNEAETTDYNRIVGEMKGIKSTIDANKAVKDLELEAEATAVIEQVITAQNFNRAGAPVDPDVEDKQRFALQRKGITEFCRTGKVDSQKFALASGTNSGVLMPKAIPGYSVTKWARNAYRRGFEALGVPTFSVNYTDNMKLPIFDDVAAVANDDQEGATSGVNADATTSATAVDLDLKEYHSKAQWLSKKLIAASDFDPLSLVIPAAQGRIEKQEDVNWSTLVKAATVGKTAAAVAAITYAEWIAFDDSLGAAYEGTPQFIVVSPTMKTALRTMVDGASRLLIDFENGISIYNNKPLITCANLETLAANHVVAAVIAIDALNGAVIRDASLNEVVRYENVPAYPGQVGIEALGWSAFGFNPAAVRTLKTAIS